MISPIRVLRHEVTCKWKDAQFYYKYLNVRKQGGPVFLGSDPADEVMALVYLKVFCQRYIECYAPFPAAVQLRPFLHTFQGKKW